MTHAHRPLTRFGEPGRVRRAATHEDIASLAYFYWVARGRGDGGAENDWLRAERELQERFES